MGNREITVSSSYFYTPLFNDTTQISLPSLGWGSGASISIALNRHHSSEVLQHDRWKDTCLSIRKWPPDVMSWLIWKDPDVVKDWRQEEKGTTEDEMVRWHHQLLEVTQTQVHWVSDVIQPSHPLSSPSPPAFNLSHHQCLFQFFASGGQRIGVSASTSVLPMNIQD